MTGLGVSDLMAKSHLELVPKSSVGQQPDVHSQGKATALHYWQGVPSATKGPSSVTREGQERRNSGYSHPAYFNSYHQ
jgi:hypothetical protein